MKNLQSIVEKLSQFNNLCFTKKQWEIIFKGCGCPKSAYFWMAIRDLCMWKSDKLYYLSDIDNKSFEQVWQKYSNSNSNSVKKSQKKAKDIEQRMEKINQWRSTHML